MDSREDDRSATLVSKVRGDDDDDDDEDVDVKDKIMSASMGIRVSAALT